MKKISLITVAYKNSNVVVDLLNSIQKYNDIGDELEVIVVDNSPEDCRIGDAIKQADYKGYIYIQADNKGFGAGNNIGAAVAKGEILAFINPDIILIEPIFKKVLDKFAVNGKLVWIGGKLLDEAGRNNFSFGYRFEYSKYSFLDSLKKRIFPSKIIFDADTMFLIGADIFIRRVVFEMIGRFDENIFMYYEESDLVRRILNEEKGYKLQFCPEIKMIHLAGHSLSWDSELAIDMAAKSLMYYCNKHNIDYRKIYQDIYVIEKKKLLIDSIFRPTVAQNRIRYIQQIEKYFL